MLGELVKHTNREYICFIISLAMILDQLRVPVWHFKAITNIDDLIALLMVHHVVI